MIGRRSLLLGLAALMCAAALFAVAVLLLGRFGPTEQHIVVTTVLLSAAGVLALPAVVLGEQSRYRAVALLNALLAAAAGATGAAAVWWETPTLARIAGSAYAAAAASAQAGGLLARSGDDPPLVRRLYAASLVSVVALASMVVALIWMQIDSTVYARVLGSVAIVDALLVALQPLAARIRPVSHHYRVLLTRTDGSSALRELDATDHAGAAARAIRDEERLGAPVRSVRFEDERAATR